MKAGEEAKLDQIRELGVGFSLPLLGKFGLKCMLKCTFLLAYTEPSVPWFTHHLLRVTELKEHKVTDEKKKSVYQCEGKVKSQSLLESFKMAFKFFQMLLFQL